ncbi:MAG: hypothetical protein KAW41_03485 [Candidatus Diapherotrites archaeon]|nr:hypothetical protein [Candidatus Diapherotrites archaeon]
MYWWFVESIYVLDVLIFAYLAWYFWRKRKTATGDTRVVVTTLAALTAILTLQEFYFGVNTLTDPNKVAIMSSLFPLVQPQWIYAKLILTVGGLLIVYTLYKVRGK